MGRISMAICSLILNLSPGICWVTRTLIINSTKLNRIKTSSLFDAQKASRTALLGIKMHDDICSHGTLLSKRAQKSAGRKLLTPLLPSAGWRRHYLIPAEGIPLTDQVQGRNLGNNRERFRRRQRHETFFLRLIMMKEKFMFFFHRRKKQTERNFSLQFFCIFNNLDHPYCPTVLWIVAPDGITFVLRLYLRLSWCL